MFRLKALRSLLSISNDPIATMREILPLLLRFIRTSPECLQHEVTLASRKAITADQMFSDNLTIRLALARLIRPGPLVICPKNFKTTSGSLEKSGANSARRVTLLDSDTSKGKKSSENLTPRSADAYSSNSFNKAKAEEISEGENIASHILSQALEILSQIFNQGNGKLGLNIFTFPCIFCFDSCFQKNSGTFSRTRKIILVIVWKQLSFFLLHPKFTKKPGLYSVILENILVILSHHQTQSCFATTHAFIQCRTRHLGSIRLSQNQDFYRRCAVFSQQMI